MHSPLHQLPPHPTVTNDTRDTNRPSRGSQSSQGTPTGRVRGTPTPIQYTDNQRQQPQVPRGGHPRSRSRHRSHVARTSQEQALHRPIVGSDSHPTDLHSHGHNQQFSQGPQERTDPHARFQQHAGRNHAQRLGPTEPDDDSRRVGCHSMGMDLHPDRGRNRHQRIHRQILPHHPSTPAALAPSQRRLGNLHMATGHEDAVGGHLQQSDQGTTGRQPVSATQGQRQAHLGQQRVPDHFVPIQQPAIRDLGTNPIRQPRHSLDAYNPGTLVQRRHTQRKEGIRERQEGHQIPREEQGALGTARPRGPVPWSRPGALPPSYQTTHTTHAHYPDLSFRRDRHSVTCPAPTGRQRLPLFPVGNRSVLQSATSFTLPHDAHGRRRRF